MQETTTIQTAEMHVLQQTAGWMVNLDWNLYL